MVDSEHEYFDVHRSRTFLKGVHVLRVSPLSLLPRIPGGKPFRFFLSCILFALKGLFIKKIDVILVYSPPIFMGISGYIISRIRKAPFVFNMQDIHPKVLFDSGVIKSRSLRWILSKMERISYEKASMFLVYSSGNKDYLLQRGVEREISIIPNWADIVPLSSTDAVKTFRNEELIGDRFLVSYAGTIQQAQGLEVVLETAVALKEHDNILFILAGEGSSKSDLQNVIGARDITNVLLRPVMTKDRYIRFLCASDICLIALSSDTPLQTVPGKLADVMACGRPIIAVVNQRGDAASIIRESGCGFCVDQGDTAAFSQSVLRLLRDDALRREMGENARLFAERHFSRSICTKRIEEVLCHAARRDQFNQTNCRR
jgi:glycosyltransferase involved in cell wall biosynthesis